ncbi:lipid-binding protein [Pedobacter antarcticus 4BY]|uniref:Lipid-binding protein n=2 Tax=Pedobacter antarcticus TaxID=34086 RepID=A0A081PJW2_9SPHI|nr:YceI family protein [Pedobacter antarcticus]KEQ30985.1 lipid-binding protein [Pedobacter antarcticus 4BY]SFF21509.1 Polyisoprenoid-binding protein YceI [Pedobacter antarcticus]
MKQITTLTAVAVTTVFVLSSFTIAPRYAYAGSVTKLELSKKAISFKVDPGQSKLTWLAKKVTGEHAGTIQVRSGSLEVDNNVLKGGSFELDTKTITVTDIEDKEGNAKLLGHLKSDDFFAVEKFGTAKFVITSAQSKGSGLYQIKGNLTIKGITNEVTFPANVTLDNNKLVAKAKIKVDRTKYDIKFRSKSFFENLGDKTIYDDFELDIQLVANK